MRAPEESTHSRGPDADRIRATEHTRLRALVAADMEVANRLHAEDFQLISPGGDSLSKEQYLAAIASGDLRYLVFEPVSSIAVRLYEGVAIIRYESQIEAIVGSASFPLRRYWHTDVYEQHADLWQVVWSHATEVRRAPG